MRTLWTVKPGFQCRTSTGKKGQTIVSYAEKMLGDVNTKSEIKHPNEIYWSETRKTIAELFEIKWDHSCNFMHKTICKATTTQLMKVKGWYYLSCTNRNHGVMYCDGELWCSKCQIQIDVPIPRFSIRFGRSYRDYYL
ncbi:hypothetical protein C5167_016386 [Papaver somniferum]|nr:hypothetical protein C5167_016386 [Papaver somniferum]